MYLLLPFFLCWCRWWGIVSRYSDIWYNPNRDEIRATKTISLVGQIVRGIRYSDPQRVASFRRSYRLLSGRSLFEDSITASDGRRDRPWSDFLRSNSYGETIASAPRRNGQFEAVLSGDSKTLDRARWAIKKKRYSTAAALLDCARFRVESGWIVVNHTCVHVCAHTIMAFAAKSGSGLQLSGCEWLIYFMIFYVSPRINYHLLVPVVNGGCTQWINLRQIIFQREMKGLNHISYEAKGGKLKICNELRHFARNTTCHVFQF